MNDEKGRKTKLVIRKAEPRDGRGMAEILTPIVRTGRYTALLGKFTAIGETEFIRSFPKRGVLLVAEEREKDGTNHLLGFQTLEPYAPYSAAFDHVAIIGTYIRLDCRRKGIGRLLMKAMLPLARRRGFRKLFTFVRKDNPNALGFYKSWGFITAGIARKQARIRGRYVDEVIIEKFL